MDLVVCINTVEQQVEAAGVITSADRRVQFMRGDGMLGIDTARVALATVDSGTDDTKRRIRENEV